MALRGSVMSDLRSRAVVPGALAGTLLAVGLLGAVGPVAPASAAEDAAAVTKTPKLTSRLDVPSARVAARAQGAPVEALSERTSTSTTWVNPDGSFDTELAMAPVRVKQPDGSWADVDLSLARGASGVIGPKVSPVPFAVAGAGSSTVASAALAAAVTEVGWSGPLPAPVLTGPTATYPEVRPGVDLVVRALRSGFEVSFVIKSRPTGPLSLPLSLTLRGLSASVQADGALSLVDGTGKELGRGGAPVMYGADTVPGTTMPAHEAPVMAALSTPAPASLSGLAPSAAKAGASGLLASSVTTSTWSLTPDPAFLADSSVVYPVTVDPSYTFSINDDTYVKSDVTTSQYSATRLYIGVNGAGAVARTMMRISAIPSVLVGKYISSASLQLYNSYSATCTVSLAPVNLYKVGAWTSSTVWSTQPTTSGSISSQNFVNAGPNNACGGAAYGNLDLTSVVRGWAAGTDNTKNFEVRSIETDVHGWKEFYSVDDGGGVPRIKVVYWAYPSTPGPVSVTPGGGVSPSATTNTTTPVLSTVVNSATGDVTQARFEIYNGASLVWSGTSAVGKSGAISQIAVPASAGLVVGTAYTVKAWGITGAATSAQASTPVTFTVDTTAPPAPTVTAATYVAGAWASALVPDTFTVARPAGDVDRYSYQFDAGPLTTVSSAGASTPVSITPPAGWHTLNVYALDTAGNTSTAGTFTFGTPGVSAPADGAKTLGGVTLNANAPSTETGVRFQYRRADTDSWTDIPVANVTKAGTAVAAWPVTTVVSGSQATAPAQLVWDAKTTLGSDGPAQIQAVFTGASTITTGNAPVVTLDSKAYGLMYASADVGVGSVSLQTGNLAITGSDAGVASFGGGLAVSRTFNSLDASLVPATGPAVFGPGWVTTTNSEVSDWVRADDLGSQVRLTDSDGGLWYFTRTSSGYKAVSDAALDGYTLTATGTSKNYVFTLTDLDGSTTTIRAVNPSWSGTPSPATPQPYRITATQAAGVTGSSSFAYNSDGTPAALIAPAPPGVSCTVSSIVAGCRLLAFTYTGTGAATRLSKVTLKTTTTTGSPVSVDVACYTYDGTTANRLAQAWDPRVGGGAGWGTTCGAPVQPTTYAYVSGGANDGKIAMITPPGLAGVSIAYDSSGRFSSASRTHSGTYGGAILTTTVGYGVSIAATTSGDDTHPDLSATRVAAWGQTSVPLAAAVVYSPGDTITDLRDGTVYAWDGDGRVTNIAVYSGTGQDGWRTDATDYDTNGNTVRTLSVANRDRALNPSDYTDELGPLGLGSATSTAISDALSTRTLYAANGIDITDVYGPAHRFVLPDGVTTSVGRSHDHTDYGTTNYPTVSPSDWTTGAPLHVATRTTQAATLTLSAAPVNETDTTETRYAYGLSATDHPGWDLHQPMATTTENGTTDITRQTRYQADPVTGNVKDAGAVIEQRQPSAAGTTASPGTRVTTYYTAGAHNPAGCVSSVWYGQVCKTAPGAQPTTTGLPGLATTTYTYDLALRPTVVTETVTPAGGGTSTRTTTTTYKNAGASPQVDTSTISGGVGSTVPAVTYGYDTSTGLQTTISDGTATQTTAYDDFGQTTTHTGADGAKTTTTRDSLDRTSSTTWTQTDGTTTLATANYAYVPTSSGDHRRELATITDSVFGAITATYDTASGALTTQTLATGLTQTFTTDTTGDTTATTWADSGGNVFLTDSQVSDIHGRWRREALGGADPGWIARTYTYDPAGRLTAVAEQQDTGTCQTRTYIFDSNSNRTNANAYPADGTGACSTATTPTATQALSYDNADRMLPTGAAAGTVYDAWGRITALPAGLTSTSGSGAATAGYYANDLVSSLSQGGATRTWTLDPAGRLASMISTGLGSTALVNHYGDASSDSPAWTTDTAASGTVTTRRYITGFAGLLAEAATTGATTTTTVELTGLHGDVLRTTSPGAALSPDGVGVYSDEYGQVIDPDTGSVTTGPRYGWLGAKQRATDTGTTGLTLMGVRLYAPVIGRLLSTDPVYGGNANTYTYPADPVNLADLDGRSRAPIERGGRGLPMYWPIKGPSMGQLCPRAQWSSHNCATVYGAGDWAVRVATRLFHVTNPRARNDRVDAFVHAYWAALLTIELGYGSAVTYAKSWENQPKQQYLPSWMDSRNDEIGAAVGLNTPMEKLAQRIYGMAIHGKLVTLE